MRVWLPIAILCIAPNLILGWDHFGVGGMLFWIGIACLAIAPFTLYCYLRLETLRPVFTVAVLSFMAGLGMSAYNGVKMTINERGMWADRLLADLDALLFFGDPWPYVSWLHFPDWHFVYHWAWGLFICFALFKAREDVRAISGWFILWGLVAPVVQFLVPAAGPVFYDDLGLGDRFAAIPEPVYADYLWALYTSQGTAVGGGISAMPSMHIAAVTWAAIMLRHWTAWAFAFAILVLSVVTGWHYAVDGLVGGALAWAVMALVKRVRLPGTGATSARP
ncbi:phosphatase PAP2 family protein, partial [Sphingomicrobium astaxanthinifaciens]